MKTQRAPLASENSRLMSCRSTRSCRSSCCSSDNSTCKSDFQGSILAIASLNDFSTAWRSASVQRRMNGNSARLRARRMRLEMTISLCGPEPRSHSPQRLAKSSNLGMLMDARPLGPSLGFAAPLRFAVGQALFEGQNLVTNFCGPLVFFLLRSFLHFAAEANQLRLLVGAALPAARPLADMLRLAVNVGDQRCQLLLEKNVVVRAAETA